MFIVTAVVTVIPDKIEIVDELQPLSPFFFQLQ